MKLDIKFNKIKNRKIYSLKEMDEKCFIKNHHTVYNSCDFISVKEYRKQKLQKLIEL